MMVICLLFNNASVAYAQEPSLDLYAGAAVLLDGASGRVLYEKNGYNPMAMASTTKIMTCILVLEHAALDEQAEVSAYAASMPKVKMYASRGECYEVRSLLFSMMLESHNDSAVILAEHIGKQYLPKELQMKNVSDYTLSESKEAVKAFANLMNEKAGEIGCLNTWFVTPNGLDATESLEIDGETVQKEHKTTAVDLAKIMAYCILESPGRDLFCEISQAAGYSFCENNRMVNCYNHNAFMQMMDGVVAGKTGFTNKAGYCYVGALRQDGKTLIAVVLASGWPNHKEYKWSDTQKLMRYGLDCFEVKIINGEEQRLPLSHLHTIRVDKGCTPELGKPVYATVAIPERQDGNAECKEPLKLMMRRDESVSVEWTEKDALTAPVAAGTVVGEIAYSVDGTVYYRESIVVVEDVKAIDLPWCFVQIVTRYLHL